MNKYARVITLLAASLVVSACTMRDAAVIATVPAHVIGTTLGMTAVVVDESFKTAEEVVEANPRYDHRRAYREEPRTSVGAGEPHYYKAEVLVETRGPARIESMQMLDSQDVTDFWR